MRGSFKAQTTIGIGGTGFLINGAPTYADNEKVEGLLFNVRTVNATFDDTLGQVRWFDDDGSRSKNEAAGYGAWTSPESAVANTARYIDGLSQYRAHGILAVNLCLQGGHPILGMPWIEEGNGSAGRRPNGHRDFYHNSAFNIDGSLDETHMKRVGDVIETCDRSGMAVILQLFYFGQDPVFETETQVCAAVDRAVDWICERGYFNVIVEIANEVMQGHFHHDILKPGRVAELVHRARDGAQDRHGRDLVVSTSEAALLSPEQWQDDEIDRVFEACDLVIIHGGDNVETGRVGDASELVKKVDRIRGSDWYKKRPRPIITNESHGAQAFEAMVKRGVSFGLHSIYFQTMFPPKWGVWENDTSWFFSRAKEITS
jgi:hypothetical protein